MTKARDISNLVGSDGIIDNTKISLDANEVPSLDTAKITTGTFASARINNASLSAITALPSGVGGTAWQSVQTSAFTAVAGRGYPCNTTSSAFTVTLPASPSAGDTIQLVDYAGTFDTNNLTVNPNSNKIEGGTSNLLLTGDREGVTLTYIDATQGWLSTSGIQEGTDALSPAPYSVDFLVIAGGGGGGSRVAGGGGAGGYRNSYSTETSGGGGSSEASLSFNIGTVYTITVGAGGGGGTAGNGSNGSVGLNSSISGTGITTITSNGGGLGIGYEQTGNANGGSGGGAGLSGSSAGSGTANQGYGGGGTNTSGGGGGGAGGAGTTSNVFAYGGNGGAGLASSITGSSVSRAGGGGGGGAGNVGGLGGTASSGGGAGAQSSTGVGTAGTANTGGGGGAGGDTGATGAAGGAGGSGVVILRIPTANYSGTTTGSPTVTTDGSDKVIVFNSSGTITG